VIFGDARRYELLGTLGLDNAAALVLTIDAMAGLETTVRRVRAEHPDLCVVVRARDAGHASRLYKLGATDAVPETVEASLQLAETVLVVLGVPMGPVIASVHEKRAELRSEIEAAAPGQPIMALPPRSRIGGAAPPLNEPQAGG
jgi:CPA2 family monovalent cation:H+ antiporter-2